MFVPVTPDADSMEVGRHIRGKFRVGVRYGDNIMVRRALVIESCLGDEIE